MSGSVDLFGEPIVSTRSAFGTNESSVGGTDEWLTPPSLLERLGHFDLDPCASQRRPWPTADRHLTIVDDGLRYPWEGRVWCNPPYSKAEPWLHRMAEHGSGLTLIFARTDTRVWHQYVWARAHGILFMPGRLTFYAASGRPAPGNAGAPSALIAYSDHDVDVLARSGIPGALVSAPRMLEEA